MDRPLFQGCLPDFGSCALNPGPEPPKLHLVTGRRSSQLRSEIRRLCPRKPGVYGMLDRHGELIYVGKAKSLRGRLLTYFRRRSRDPKAGRILRHTASIAWETSPNEFAALHRELELIRRWRPRLNIQGQPQRRHFTFVCLGRPPAPYLFLARRPPVNTLACFGPIPLGVRAREAVRRLNDWFLLRDCPQVQEMVFADQAELFPIVRSAGCLRYEIGTCLGPCLAACSQLDYSARARQARDFLAGIDLAPLVILERDMATAAATQQFERAAALRDKLASLRWLHDKLGQQRLRLRESFVYPVSGMGRETIWYLVHGGRTVAAIPEPQDPEGAGAAAELIEAIYQKDPGRLLDSYEHYDGLLLVASWFRRHPHQRKRTLPPGDALALCLKRGIAPAKKD
jgi:excinuclease ABC subunit C